MDEIIEDPISAQVKELLSIFRDDLSGVAFPDVSQKILEELVEQVRTKTAELDEANARAAAARDALDASQNELLQKCVRGLAYAKVYAEDREELLDKLSSINLGKTARIPKKAKSDESSSSEKVEKKPIKQKKNEDTAPASDTVSVM